MARRVMRVGTNPHFSFGAKTGMIGYRDCGKSAKTAKSVKVVRGMHPPICRETSGRRPSVRSKSV